MLRENLTGEGEASRFTTKSQGKWHKRKITIIRSNFSKSYQVKKTSKPKVLNN